MNEHDIDRIAAAMNALRPDWPTRSLRTLLKKPELVNRPRRDVAVALAWVACEPATATPARVLEAGPWWRAATVLGDSVVIEHIAPGERCKTCGLPRHRCQRNPYGEHDFEPDFKRARETDVSPVIAELKGHLERTRPPSDPRPVIRAENAQAARVMLHGTKEDADA